jgi:hypothetical protein
LISSDSPDEARATLLDARAATTTPAFQPGARPPGGGFIEPASSPARAISQAMIEFEFHISPVRSSSRPQTRIGIWGTNSRRRLASATSSLSLRGLSTASPMSGITPSRHIRIS